MAANSRMTIAVHALAWLALAQRRGHEVLTSDHVAASVNTCPILTTPVSVKAARIPARTMAEA